MASYIVLEPPPEAEAGGTIVVRDGFHVIAFLVPFLWFLWHRMWIEALIAFAIALAFGIAGSFAGTGFAASVLSLAVSVFFGLEAAALRVAALRRRGWREWGVVEAGSVADAELRYLAEAGDVEPRPEPWAVAPSPAPAFARRPSGPSFDLLGTPGAR